MGRWGGAERRKAVNGWCVCGGGDEKGWEKGEERSRTCVIIYFQTKPYLLLQITDILSKGASDHKPP